MLVFFSSDLCKSLLFPSLALLQLQQIAEQLGSFSRNSTLEPMSFLLCPQLWDSRKTEHQTTPRGGKSSSCECVFFSLLQTDRAPETSGSCNYSIDAKCNFLNRRKMLQRAALAAAPCGTSAPVLRGRDCRATHPPAGLVSLLSSPALQLKSRWPNVSLKERRWRIPLRDLELCKLFPRSESSSLAADYRNLVSAGN